MIQYYYLVHRLPSVVLLSVVQVISIMTIFSWFNISLRIMPLFVYLSSQSQDGIVPHSYFVFLTLMYLKYKGQVFSRTSLHLDLSEPALFISSFKFWLLHGHHKGILEQTVFKIVVCVLEWTDVSPSDIRGSWLVNDILHKVIWSFVTLNSLVLFIRTVDFTLTISSFSFFKNNELAESTFHRKCENLTGNWISYLEVAFHGEKNKVYLLLTS